MEWESEGAYWMRGHMGWLRTCAPVCLCATLCLWPSASPFSHRVTHCAPSPHAHSYPQLPSWSLLLTPLHICCAPTTLPLPPPPQVLKGAIDFKSDPWPRISEAAKDCVRRLLDMDPSKRADAATILRHEW